MLDAFKKTGTSGKETREQVDELHALIGTAREERSALIAMLTQVQLQSARLAQARKALQQVDEKAGRAAAKIGEVDRRLARIDERTRELETLDLRIGTLAEAVAQAEQSAKRLTAPDGELQKHRNAVQALSSQAIETRASLDALKSEQSALDDLRERLHHALGDVEGMAERSVALEREIDRLRGMADHLGQDYGRLRDASRAVREQTGATVETIKDIERRLGPLARLLETIRVTEERMISIDALAGHVARKLATLERQKRTVEHAVLESDRLSEMIRNMDVQIGKLNDGARQAARTEEMIERIERLAREVSGRLDAALEARESLATATTDRVAETFSRLSELAQGAQSTLRSLQAERELAERTERGMKLLGSRASGEGGGKRPV